MSEKAVFFQGELAVLCVDGTLIPKNGEREYLLEAGFVVDPETQEIVGTEEDIEIIGDIYGGATMDELRRFGGV